METAELWEIVSANLLLCLINVFNQAHPLVPQHCAQASLRRELQCGSLSEQDGNLQQGQQQTGFALAGRAPSEVPPTKDYVGESFKHQSLLFSAGF